jgi:hypothetical protein
MKPNNEWHTFQEYPPYLHLVFHHKDSLVFWNHYWRNLNGSPGLLFLSLKSAVNPGHLSLIPWKESRCIMMLQIVHQKENF